MTADRLAFDLKRALALARGRHPAEALLVAAPPADAPPRCASAGSSPTPTASSPVPADIGEAEDCCVDARRRRVWRLPADAAAARQIAAAAVGPADLAAGRAGAGCRTRASVRRRPAAAHAAQSADAGSRRRQPIVPGAGGRQRRMFPAPSRSGWTSARRSVVSRARERRRSLRRRRATSSAARALTIDEIIARHQAAAARQAAEVTHARSPPAR